MAPAPPSRTHAWLILLCFCLTFLPLFVVMLSRFVPMHLSLRGQAQSLDWSMKLTIPFMLCWGMLVWLGRQPGVGLGKRILIWLFVPLMGFVNAVGLTAQIIPATAALLAGRQIGIIDTVESLPRHESRCRNAILLVGTERLCGYPDALRAKLAPGMRILVIGRGTWMGVIRRDVQVLDLARLSRSAPGQPAAFRPPAPESP